MIEIPQKFSNRMIQMYGVVGQSWIDALPQTLGDYGHRWSLTLRPPFELSYNYVCPVVRADGSEAVLKLGIPNRELFSEMVALQHYDGNGIVQLLEADFENQVFLLERIRPGVELVTIKDDAHATRIAAEVMLKLWKPVSSALSLLTIENWTAGLAKLRPYYSGTTGPFPSYLVDAAEQIFAEYSSSMDERVLLHGDLHHWNILSATRQPWLALDPKGVIGEREFEIYALLKNPWNQIHKNPEMKSIQKRRIDILAEVLGFEKERMLGWGVAMAVLSAWWSVEDHEGGWQGAIRVAEVLYELMMGK